MNTKLSAVSDKRRELTASVNHTWYHELVAQIS